LDNAGDALQNAIKGADLVWAETDSMNLQGNWQRSAIGDYLGNVQEPGCDDSGSTGSADQDFLFEDSLGAKGRFQIGPAAAV
jgi:hypothetical protein